MHHHSKRRSPLTVCCILTTHPPPSHHMVHMACHDATGELVRSFPSHEWIAQLLPKFGRSLLLLQVPSVRLFFVLFFSSLIFFFIFRTRELSFGPLLLLTLSRSFTRSKWMAFVTQRDGALHQTLLRLTGSFTSVCYTRSYSFFLRCTNKYVRMSVRVVWVWLLLLRILLLLLRRIRFR